MADEGNFVGLHNKEPKQQARADQFCQNRSSGCTSDTKIGSGNRNAEPQNLVSGSREDKQ